MSSTDRGSHTSLRERPTRKPAARCTCTPTMRQAGIPVIDCPAHGLAAFCRKLLVKR